MPALRDLDAGARAADVLVQLAARRVPALHGPRLADGDRPRPGGPGPVAVDRRRARSCRGRAGRRTTTTRSPRRSPSATRSTSTSRGTSLDRGPAGPVPAGHQRRPHLRHLPQPDGAQAVVHDELRGDHPQPRAALPRDRLGLVAGEDRGVHVGAAVPGVQGRAAAAGVAGGHRRGRADPRVHGAERRRGRSSGSSSSTCPRPTARSRG